MKSFLRPFLFCAAAAVAPVGFAADATATAPAAAALAAFSDAQLSDGLKSGLGTALNTAISRASASSNEPIHFARPILIFSVRAPHGCASTHSALRATRSTGSDGAAFFVK